jgi:hypothetical protein
VARHSIEKQINRSERFERFIPSDAGCAEHVASLDLSRPLQSGLPAITID